MGHRALMFKCYACSGKRLPELRFESFDSSCAKHTAIPFDNAKTRLRSQITQEGTVSSVYNQASAPKMIVAIFHQESLLSFRIEHFAFCAVG